MVTKFIELAKFIEESIDRAQADSPDRLEVLPVLRHDAESSLGSRRGDQRIGKARS